MFAAPGSITLFLLLVLWLSLSSSPFKTRPSVVVDSFSPVIVMAGNKPTITTTTTASWSRELQQRHRQQCRSLYRTLMYGSKQGQEDNNTNEVATLGAVAENDNDESALLSDGELEKQTFIDRYSEVLPAWLLNKSALEGYKYPTRIQQAALDGILKNGNQNVIVQAETGSGKTLAYLLPVLAAVDPTRSAVQAMIVVPTRELGLQVAAVAKRLAAGRSISATTTENNKSKIMIMSVLQGSQNRRQRAWAWAEPPHIVIGTPAELTNMITLAGIKRYNSLKMLVVDEVDACLLNNAGSLSLASSALHELLSKNLSPTYEDASTRTELGDTIPNNINDKVNTRPLSHSRQTIFCSATIPQPRHFIKQCIQEKWMTVGLGKDRKQQEPSFICLRGNRGEQLMPGILQHGYVVCRTGEDQKLVALKRCLNKITAAAVQADTTKKVLVFAEPQRPLEEWAEALAKDFSTSAGTTGSGVYWKESYGVQEEEGAGAVFSVLRYEDSLSKRAAAMNAFRGWEGEAKASGNRGGPYLRVLFSTDLAARGLDIADIAAVIHADLPESADTYVHRAGRTGRLGRSGQVVSIITSNQEFVLRRLSNKLGIDVKCIFRQQQAGQKKKKGGNNRASE